MRKETCIIIVNLNGKNLLKYCLDSLKSNMPKSSKVIVVDNNSNDGSRELLKKSYPWVDVIKNNSNRGFSGANNDGIKYAYKKYNPDYYYFLSNDTKVTRNFVYELIKIAKKGKTIGLLGSRQKNFENKDTIFSGDFNFFGVKYYFGKDPREVEWVSGAAFMVIREVIEKVGGLDEMYNPAYYEESDWEKRIKKGGFEIFTVPKSLVYHKGGGSSSEYPLNIFEIFYRNRVRFFLRHSPLLLFSRFFVDIIRGIKKKNIASVFSGYVLGIKSFNKQNIFYIK